MKKLLIFLIVQNIFYKLIQCCDPQNFYVTLGDIFSLKKEKDNDLLKIGFITPTLCKQKTLLKIQGMELTIEFELMDLYITKLYQENQSKYYKRYLYIAKIYELEDKQQFDYQVIVPDKENKKFEFIYRSKILSHQETGNVDIIVFGDHPLDERGLKVNQALEQEQKMDAIFILGDMAYDIHDNFGLKGDEYFDKLQPVITKVPVIFVHGNHDMIDNGKLLSYRFYYPGCEFSYENNRFNLNIANSLFSFVNPDKYFSLDQNQKLRFKKNFSSNLKKQENKIQDIKFKFIFSHRPFFCFASNNKEGCNKWNNFIWSNLINVLLENKFDYHFTGHVHLYQRFQNHVMHTPSHISSTLFDQSNLDFETVIIGTGGQIEDLPLFTQQVTKIDNLVDMPLALGYLRLSIINFNKVQGEFLQIKDKYAKPNVDYTDKFEKIID